MKAQNPQQVHHAYLGNRIIPCALLLAVNIFGALHFMPIFVQLLISSTSCVYLGCIFAGPISKGKQGHLNKGADHSQSEVIGKKQALRFPIVASAFLFGIYLIYKYINKDIVNILITIQFCLSTVISTSNLCLEFFNFSESARKVYFSWKTNKFIKEWFDMESFTVSPASIICSIACGIPVVAYYITKHWALNNVFGILFSIFAIRSINLSNFKVGFLLLWILFFYDIFWVYGTDVMVSVAKNLDIPIKLLFPYLNDEGVEKFSMLGLGDIVIPGLFVSLCIKFDIDRALTNKKVKDLSEIKIPYFSTCCIFYAFGIILTFVVMYVFDHPQPALLFLVPTCTLSVGALAMIKGETKEFMEYEGAKQQESKENSQGKKE